MTDNCEEEIQAIQGKFQVSDCAYIDILTGVTIGTKLHVVLIMKYERLPVIPDLRDP